MSSEEKNTNNEDSHLLVQAENLGKCYHLYESNRHRLFQMFSFGQRQYFKEFWALKDVSFTIKKGESIGILGKNGSGKSTLLQIIAGVLSPTCGTLKTQGRIAALLELGSGFNPEFTGRENAYLNGAILGLSRKEMDERIPEIEAFADVGNFFDQPVKLYSSGMMVRVAFAVQAQVEPDILIVDEALSVGDAYFQRKCFKRINQLLDNGTSLFLVSHDIESIRYFTQKSLLLDQGRTIAYGDSSSIILEYKALQEKSNTVSQTVQDNLQQDKKNTEKHFTNGDIILHSIKIRSSNTERKDIFYTGDNLIFDVCLETTKDIENLFVTLTFINTQGIKIYSWGTWNQDRKFINHAGYDFFTNKKFKKGEQITLQYQCECNLARGVYEVQVGITLANLLTGGKTDVAWYAEATFLEVDFPENYIFGGLTDMKMSVKIIP